MNLETHAKATELLEEIKEIEYIVHLLETAENHRLLCNPRDKTTIQISVSDKLRKALTTLLTGKKKQLEEEFKEL
jgi:hypothetical protein